MTVTPTISPLATAMPLSKITITATHHSTMPPPTDAPAQFLTLQPSSTIRPSPTSTIIPATSSPLPTPTQASVAFRVIAKNRANLRSGPGQVYDVIGGIVRSSIVQAMAHNGSQSWYLVQSEYGEKGWIAANLLESVSPQATTAVPVAATIPPSPTWVAVPTPVSATTAFAGQPVRILPLGDSITEMPTWEHNSYRRPLWKLLQSHGYHVDFVGTQVDNGNPPDFDLNHEGHSGWRADQILGALPSWLSLYTADVVLLHIGTNDLRQGQDVTSTAAEIGLIIDVLRQDNPNVIILLAKIIPTTQNFNSEIEQLNQQIGGIATQKTTIQSPLMIVDQWSGFDQYQNLFDGLHPNAQGEHIMAQRWFWMLTTPHVLGNN